MFRMIIVVALLSQVALSQKKGVFIFSAPRTTSTLLLRFFSQGIERGLIDGRVLLEPTTQIYHDSFEGDVPGYNPQSNWPHNYSQAMRQIIPEKQSFIIAKDLAYQTNFTDTQLRQIAKNYHILFLIRDPKKTVPSNLAPYYEEGALDNFAEEAIGYKALGKLFVRFCKDIHVVPWVIAAEDYLKNPKKVLSNYFNILDLQWDDSFLKLKPKTEEEKQNDPAYLVWPEWYGKAYKSTGVIKKDNSKPKESPYKNLIEEEEDLVNHLIEISLPYYNYIKRYGRWPIT